MANPYTGEVALTIDGQVQVLKLTLGALAELEDRLESGSLLDLVERFEQGRFTTRDVLSLILAGLHGGGWQGRADELAGAEIAGGVGAAVRAAGLLLARAFALPEGPGDGAV